MWGYLSKLFLKNILIMELFLSFKFFFNGIFEELKYLENKQ